MWDIKNGEKNEMLYEELIEILKELREEKNNRYNRVLPIGDLISDRWEKAEYLKFGEQTSIYDSSVVLGNVKVGKKTWIGPFTVLDGSGGIRIGDHCSISSGVHIYTHDTVKNCITGGEMPYEYSSVNIGDCCYIGPNALISRGVTLGNHCIVCTGSFVNKSYNDFSIIAGTPAKQIGEVTFKDDDVELVYYRGGAKE